MPLPGLDADRHQTFALRFGFDTLGDDVQSQR
jgi:hypothetical protein